jgi:serine/threonine protein kinase
MEKCEPAVVKNFEKFERRMLYCLRLMHSLNLIHKDIKPHNIAFSPSLNDFVFIDFGVSEYVNEKPGSYSCTFREGTFRYMSPEMKRLHPGCSGYIDLYWNDLFSLRQCMDETTVLDMDSEPSSKSTNYSNRDSCF